MSVCFAKVQTSQILFDSKKRFNKVLAMKSNLDGDGCPSRWCHKVVEVFEEGDDLVTWAASDGMRVCDLFDVICIQVIESTLFFTQVNCHSRH